MLKNGRTISIIIIIVFLIASLGCSLVPQVLRNLIASVTPTPTNTPEPTATTQPTATVTMRPEAPVALDPCFEYSTCVEAIWVGDLLPDGVQKNGLNTLILPFDQSLRIGWGWGTKTDEALQANLEHMHWFFRVDDVDYFEENWLTFGTVTYSDEPGVEYPEVRLDVVVSDWVIGEPQYIEIGFTLDAPINDGWDDIAADYEMIRKFYIEPSDLPTATPEPTATSTPRPGAPAATQGNSVSDDNADVEHRLGTVPVTIINNRSVAVKIVAVGPTSYSVTVNGGQTVNVSWAPGKYSLTAYIDGSVIGSTTWDVNENHALFTIN